MKFFYAELDNNNKVKAVHNFSKQVTAQNIISLTTYDLSVLGQTYDPTTEEFSAPTPAAKRTIKPHKFLERLPYAKRVALMGSTSAEAKLAVATLFGVYTEIELDSEELLTQLDGLVAAGEITAQEKADLLADVLPSEE